MKIDRKIIRMIEREQNINFDLSSDYNYSRVEMDMEYFLFVFRRRLSANIGMGIASNRGLKELVENPAISLYNIIVSHSYENDKGKFIVYTDANCTTLFGIIR